jgi:hypothetical protein
VAEQTKSRPKAAYPKAALLFSESVTCNLFGDGFAAGHPFFFFARRAAKDNAAGPRNPLISIW